jgi:hypothetical protein
VTVDNFNRYRISTNFKILKIGIAILLFSIVFFLVKEFRNETFNYNSIAGLAIAGLSLTGIFYYISTRKRIDYDDIKQKLYIVDEKKLTEIEVPVENIDKIYISAFGRGGDTSYVIVYRDYNNQKNKVRLYPIFLDNSIKTIKADTKRKNPNVIIRNWSIGWNEFFE